MKIKLFYTESVRTISGYSREIETNDFDSLKGLTLDEINKKDLDFEVEEDLPISCFIYQYGDLYLEKHYGPDEEDMNVVAEEVTDTK